MRRLFVCLYLALLALTGCGQSQPPVAALPVDKPNQPAAQARADTGARTDTKAEPQPDFLHQPFSSAVRQNMPANGLPPLTTITNKSIGKLYTQVEKLWPTIRFVDESGRKLQYTARVKTELGVIEIELLPDVAPNHVRSFVALAQAGYYDNLFFETRIGNPTESASPKAIAGGSPAADGDDLGSIGYWLLPEILLPEVAKQRGVRHQPGTVAAVHGVQQLDTDGCRFFICLSEAPTWDGEFTIFGKVTSGLDVAEKIFQQPVIDDDGFFQKLPLIEKVTISTTPLENAGASRTIGASESDSSLSPVLGGEGRIPREERAPLIGNVKPQVDEAQKSIDLKKKYQVVLDTNKGMIRLDLLPDVAPGHVKNFVALAKIGFYDGLIFHRIIKGFMIQGGCPQGSGMGGPGYNIKAEFNATTHEAGVLSMARSNDPNSAGSQFFICLEKTPHLDRNYTAFGKTADAESLAVVKAIGAVKTGGQDRPVEPVKINKVEVKEV